MVNSAKKFAYGVAISFLSEDENLAQTIAHKLKENLKVFVYSEQQKEIAGKDGVETFTNLFQSDARVVVILYREGWGKTKWTRVEETAIKDRFLNTGWDFLIVILLEPPQTPVWLPDSRLWFDINTFGIDEAVGVIKAQVLKEGGEVIVETFLDQADRQNEELEMLENRKKILESKQGYESALICAQDLYVKFKENSDNLFKKMNVPLQFEGDYTQYKIEGYGVRLNVKWYTQFSHSLKDSGLSIKLSEVDRRPEKRFSSSKFLDLSNLLYTFDINDLNQHGWSEMEGKKQFYKSDKIVDMWLKKVGELIHRIRVKNL